jgi:hypothetical protein
MKLGTSERFKTVPPAQRTAVEGDGTYSRSCRSYGIRTVIG